MDTWSTPATMWKIHRQPSSVWVLLMLWHTKQFWIIVCFQACSNSLGKAIFGSSMAISLCATLSGEHNIAICFKFKPVITVPATGFWNVSIQMQRINSERMQNYEICCAYLLKDKNYLWRWYGIYLVFYLGKSILFWQRSSHLVQFINYSLVCNSFFILPCLKHIYPHGAAQVLHASPCRQSHSYQLERSSCTDPAIYSGVGVGAVSMQQVCPNSHK